MKTTFFDSFHSGWHHRPSADSSPAKATPACVWQRLNNAWQQFLSLITNANDEPHIWMSCDIHGRAHWNAYDPLTGKRLYAATENEVLVWLEDRYNTH